MWAASLAEGGALSVASVSLGHLLWINVVDFHLDGAGGLVFCKLTSHH